MTLDQRTRGFKAMNEAVLAIAAELTVDAILQKLVHAARELVDARYAAIGVPDGEGGFDQFITSGMSDELIAAMGPLPRTHGLLGAILESEQPYRTDDVKRDPRFRGWWPSAHPDMASFLGVPIQSRGEIIGAFYLTDKEGADEFTDDDRRLIQMLAAHAAIAIENARLYERSRELSVVEERNRLARELHDAVSQKLFGLVLTAEAAGTLTERDPEAARKQLERLQQLAREAIAELRSIIFELRPPELDREGLVETLRKHIEVLRRVHEPEIELTDDGVPPLEPATASEVLRIAQEALQNAVRHSGAGRIGVQLAAEGGRLVVLVEDDGTGFDPSAPEVRSRRLGLTSMEERARALGGTLEITSADGAGTTVRVEVPA